MRLKLLICAAVFAVITAALVTLQIHQRQLIRNDAIDAIGCVSIYLCAACLAFSLLCNLRRYWREMAMLFSIAIVTLSLMNWILIRKRPEMAYMPHANIPSELYHHLSQPNKTTRMLSEDGPSLATTNADGFRTTYSRNEFQQYKTRIAVLGDSFTFGLLAPQEAAFPQVAEGLLRQRLRRDDLAVLNTGIVSYSPYLENLLFEGIIRDYKPTMVLLFLDATDFGDDYAYDKVAYPLDGRVHFYRRPCQMIGHLCALQEFTRPASEHLLRAVFYPRQFWRLHVLYQQPQDAATPDDYYYFRVMVDGVQETNRYFIYRHPLASIEPFLKATLNIIGTIAANAKASGASFSLFVYPRYHLYNPKEAPHNWELHEYKVDEPYQRDYFDFFERAKETSPFPIVNMLPVFDKNKRRGPFTFSHDAHWNARGHRFVAKFLADYLICSESDHLAPKP